MQPFPLEQLSPAVIALAAGLAFLAAGLVVLLGRRSIRAWLTGLDIANPEHRRTLERGARGLVAALAVAAFGIAALTTVSVGLGRLGVEVADWTPRQVVSWMLSHGLRALIIVAGAFITLRVANLAIARFQAGASGNGASRRTATLASILSSGVAGVVVFIGGLMVLRELSIDVLPLLTGAGIAGLAVGFGAQNLVRDVISGFFIILEDQVGVGDVARIQSVTGVVEAVRLRSIVLRDSDGAVHVFPNGTITTLANLGRDYAYANVDVVVESDENVERAMDALEAIGKAMAEDEACKPQLLGPLEIVGVQELRRADLTIRLRFKTLPLKQWEVAAELRRRIAVTFAAKGIRPFG